MKHDRPFNCLFIFKNVYFLRPFLLVDTKRFRVTTVCAEEVGLGAAVGVRVAALVDELRGERGATKVYGLLAAWGSQGGRNRGSQGVVNGSSGSQGVARGHKTNPNPSTVRAEEVGLSPALGVRVAPLVDEPCG